MTEVGVHEAKTRLSELLRAVEGGEEVVVTRAGVAVARIVPVAAAREERLITRRGALKDLFGENLGDWDDQEESDRMADLFGIPRVDPT